MAVYYIPLDSLSLKRQYASNTFTSSLRNTQTLQKNTKRLLFLLLLLALTVRLHTFQHISTPTGGDLNYSSLLSQHLSQSGKFVGALRGASEVASNFPGVATGGATGYTFTSRGKMCSASALESKTMINENTVIQVFLLQHRFLQLFLW